MSEQGWGARERIGCKKIQENQENAGDPRDARNNREIVEQTDPKHYNCRLLKLNVMFAANEPSYVFIGFPIVVRERESVCVYEKERQRREGKRQRKITGRRQRKFEMRRDAQPEKE